MAIGRKGGGYATLSPTQNYLGQAITRLEDNAFKYRQEQRLAEEKKAENESNIQSQRAKELEALDKFEKEHPILKIGMDKIDNPTTLSAFEFKKKYADANANYTATGDRKFLDERENAKNSLLGLAQLPKTISDFTANLEKGVLEGDYNEHSALKRASILDKVQKGEYVYTPDEKGNPLFTIYETDDNGKVTNILKNQVPPQKLLDEMKPVPSFNYNGESGKKGSKSLIETFEDSLGKVQSEEFKDGKIIKTFKGAEQMAENMANDVTKNYNQVYQMSLLMGQEPKDSLSDYTPRELFEIKEKVKADLVGRIPRSEKPDYEAERIRLQKLKELNDQNNADRVYNQKERELNKETVTVKEGETVTPYGKKIPTKTTTITKKQPKTKGVYAGVDENGKIIYK
jgi:hypothetical protein